ncbi:uncharacterized protein PHALS_00316 [Plasmopara halstedii]|uniref:Spp2/MOS2 G-patch domain-containing protein n=1 Tax=Plasmopara halstedii TaxID=4781 RepID=A0A0P1A796_PLAHL|nr:uncharacterized protein PHALS_00316 [Plasmopara halstedii]CEG35994.1 hypothetical protein PHALS_00316 [Plasmopara halstedii]|eukprot:XP_024572363.1 hypothetical protein PHALS_00316 [Plasmopara halstedii]
MKLGGFTLKKGKKKALVASADFKVCNPTTRQVSEKVYVTEFDPTVPAALTEYGKQPLVIPLLASTTQNVVSKDIKNCNEPELTIEIGTSVDEQAAAEILAETHAHATTHNSDQTLVIPSERGEKRAELFSNNNSQLHKNGKLPILQQNVVPGLDQLQDVVDKYRHDVASRPEALDVHSDVYESIPIEEFGAALLRGMGWTGNVNADDVGLTPQPRHKLLGLGATKRPTLPGEEKKKTRKKQKKEVSKDKKSDRDDRRRPSSVEKTLNGKSIGKN